MLYLDYNSTHPPIPDIVRKNRDRYLENWANPSGISRASQKNQTWIEDSRRQTAGILGVAPGSVHFVSTGTEALYQMVATFAPDKKVAVVSAYEHSAFYAACADAGLTVVEIDPDSSGCVEPHRALQTLRKAIDEHTPNSVAFLAVIALNNETGIVQPLGDLAQAAHDAGVPFISDTIQAAGKIDCGYRRLDGYAVNGHKIGAGPGCAAVVLPGRKAVPLFRGGLQEDERRAGTENAEAAANLADALAFQMNGLAEKNVKLATFQARIENTLTKTCGAVIAGSGSQRSQNTTFAVFPEMANMDFVLMGLDRADIVLSTGSSCKSRTRQPSPLLLKMGFSKSDALRALRISTGVFTTQEEVERFLNNFQEIYRASL